MVYQTGPSILSVPFETLPDGFGDLFQMFFWGIGDTHQQLCMGVSIHGGIPKMDGL